MATHSSFLAWRTPWPGETGRPQALGHKVSDTSEVAEHTYIYVCVLFSTAPPEFIICRLSDNDHSDWCEVLSHCGFDLHFFNS